ncbi:MAG: hypothetical protein ACI9SY_000673, partial [Candidatus Paceibacteria bacterium]
APFKTGAFSICIANNRQYGTVGTISVPKERDMERIIPNFYVQQTNHHFDGAISLLKVKADMAVNAQQQQRDDVDTFNLMIPI